MKRKPRVGDTVWVVEWCTKLAFEGDDPEDGIDRDRCTYKTRPAETREQAEAIAREVFPLDQFGVVKYWQSEFQAYDEDDAAMYPHVGYWDAITDEQYYEGEE